MHAAMLLELVAEAAPDRTALGSQGSGRTYCELFSDVAIMLFTSGTTSEPKAAVLRHRHLTSYILSTVDFLGAGEEEAQLVSVPTYHVAGTSAVLSSVFAGRRIFYLPIFDPEAWVRTAREQSITQAMVVPTMLRRLLDEIERAGVSLPALRHLSYGGGRLRVPAIERAMTMLPDVNWVNAYGLTETSSTICVLGPDDHRAAERIHFRPELPHSETGKLLRRVLKADLTDLA